jgi:ribosome biogenesis GTPase A
MVPRPHAPDPAGVADRIKIDVVIELLDARLPIQRQPMLADLTQGRPALKILNKQDLADPGVPRCGCITPMPNTRATIELDAGEPRQRAIIKACRELAPLRWHGQTDAGADLRGIPNVDKSTLINTLTGKATKPVTRPASPKPSSVFRSTTTFIRTHARFCGRASSPKVA